GPESCVRSIGSSMGDQERGGQERGGRRRGRRAAAFGIAGARGEDYLAPAVCPQGPRRRETRMGIMDFVKGGVREMMIARPDNLKHLVVYKHPDQNVPMYSQLTVDSDECA